MFQPGVVELVCAGEAVVEVEDSVILLHILIQSQQQIPVHSTHTHSKYTSASSQGDTDGNPVGRLVYQILVRLLDQTQSAVRFLD